MGIGQDSFTSLPPSPIHIENGLYRPEGDYHTVPLCNPEGDREITASKSDGADMEGEPPDRGKPPSLLRRPCYYLSSFVKCLPVIFISCIVGWSYYAYLVAVLLTSMSGHPAEQVLCGTVFHCLALMFVWSYLMVVFTAPGVVPASWRLTQQEVDRLAAAHSEEEWKSILNQFSSQRNCPVRQRSVQAAVRYCEKCLAIKPDRSHHCSVCDNCTLKMDHHCPWVNNCVGFHNYKFFLLFLGYAVSYCLWIAATSLRHFLRIWLRREQEEDTAATKYHLLFVFFVSILFSLSLSSLFWYHIWLLLHNRSTLEQFRAPMFENNRSDPDGWSMGRLNNVREVLGPDWWLWPLPVNTVMGDGITFPVRLHIADCTTYHSIGTSLPSRAETPSRTLVNPILGVDGSVLQSCPHPAPGTLSSDCRLTITPDSGVGETEVTLTEVTLTEVRLDSNGHIQTVVLPDVEANSGPRS